MGEVIHGEYGRWLNDAGLHSVTNYELHKSIYSGFNDHNFFRDRPQCPAAAEAIGRQALHLCGQPRRGPDRQQAAQRRSIWRPVYMCLMTLPGIPSIYYGGRVGHWRAVRTRTSDDALRPAVSLADGEKLCRPPHRAHRPPWKDPRGK